MHQFWSGAVFGLFGSSFLSSAPNWFSLVAIFFASVLDSLFYSNCWSDLVLFVATVVCDFVPLVFVLFSSGYYTFVGGNLVTWRNKKQHVVARSNVEAEYRAMAHTVSEMLWVQSHLCDMGVSIPGTRDMYCDN